MMRDFNNQNIITKSQVYSQISPCNIIDGIFAKTINFHGIHCNFCLDIPDITEEDQRRRERQNDIARFTALLMSGFDYPDKRTDDLLKNNNFDDIFRDEIYTGLACSENLLHDLGVI